MLREYFTNRWVIGGFCFLTVFGIACYFWYQHELAPYEQSKAETAEMLRQADLQKSDTDRDAKPTADAPMESTTSTTEKNRNPDIGSQEETNRNETEDKGFFLTDDIYIGPKPPPIPVPKNALISPYGFGPYPELPEGFGPITWPRKSAESELMIRVRIKLLKQGVPVEGTVMSNGLVYPIIKGVCYVRWGETSRGRRYLRDVLGHPDDDMETIEQEKKRRRESVTASDFPGIKLIPYEEGGIDPYTFLDLPK